MALTGGRLRRVHLRGHSNVLKRLLVHVCGANLGLLMREQTDVRTPRSLQGRAAALLDALIQALSRRWRLVRPPDRLVLLIRAFRRGLPPPRSVINSFHSRYKVAVLPRPASPGCVGPFWPWVAWSTYLKDSW